VHALGGRRVRPPICRQLSAHAVHRAPRQLPKGFERRRGVKLVIDRPGHPREMSRACLTMMMRLSTYAENGPDVGTCPYNTLAGFRWTVYTGKIGEGLESPGTCRNRSWRRGAIHIAGLRVLSSSKLPRVTEFAGVTSVAQDSSRAPARTSPRGYLRRAESQGIGRPPWSAHSQWCLLHPSNRADWLVAIVERLLAFAALFQ
jgi:hypothetical protein